VPNKPHILASGTEYFTGIAGRKPKSRAKDVLHFIKRKAQSNFCQHFSNFFFKILKKKVIGLIGML